MLRQPLASLDYLEGRRYRTFGGILARLGKPKEGTASITLKPFEVTIVISDECGRLVVERPLHAAKLFGIELVQQSSRANNVIEKRGNLPAFSRKRAGLYLSCPCRHRTARKILNATTIIAA